MENKAKFVHPAELGMTQFPINTREELCNISKALSAGLNPRQAQQQSKSQYVPQERKQSYNVVK